MSKYNACIRDHVGAAGLMQHDCQTPLAFLAGPGSYNIDLGSPPMGPYAPDSPARCGSPSRDPNRKGSSFTSPVRPELFKHPEGGHLGSYLNINYTKVWGFLWDVILVAY